MTAAGFHVRRGSAEDAPGIVTVLEVVVSENLYSAINRAWTVEQQRTYLASLSSREAFHVAIDVSGRIVGYQSLDLYSGILPSMAHVGTLGTFVLPDWRERGVGRALFMATSQFARSSAYRKLVIQVRASNLAAQHFYKQCGFTECGRLTDQVLIGGQMDDEVVMECFLTSAP